MARISVTVSPAAARDQIVGRHGDGWRVRIAAPPERGRANAALCALLAETLGVPRRTVNVVAGHNARRKIVDVEGLASEEIDRRLG